MPRWILLFFIVLFSATPARADTIVASSCSQADVQTAVTASSDGDTVEIPKGTALAGSSNTVTIGDVQ